jgi:hypothetical protein
MSRKTEAPFSVLDYDDGIGRELMDLHGLAVLFENAAENRGSLDLDEDEREALFYLVVHTVERLNEKVRQVEAALREGDEAAG